MEEESIERMNRMEDVRAIAMIEDEERASEELLLELATNTEPEERLLALTSLDQMGSLSSSR